MEERRVTARFVARVVFVFRVYSLDIGAVLKPAGFDDYNIRAFVGARNKVAVRTKLSKDAFRVNQGFGAVQTHGADLRYGLRQGSLTLILPSGGIVHSLQLR